MYVCAKREIVKEVHNIYKHRELKRSLERFHKIHYKSSSTIS